MLAPGPRGRRRRVVTTAAAAVALVGVALRTPAAGALLADAGLPAAVECVAGGPCERSASAAGGLARDFARDCGDGGDGVQLLQQDARFRGLAAAAVWERPPQQPLAAPSAELPFDAASSALDWAMPADPAASMGLLQGLSAQAGGGFGQRHSSAGVEDASSAAPTTTWDNGLPALGLTYNASGDMKAFLSALLTNSVACVVLLAIFTVLRVRYPLLYSCRVLKGTAPSSPDYTNPFSWVKASMCTRLEENVESCGLDHAMLIEFTNFAMKVCATVGIPMLFITSPINSLSQGNPAGNDHMSYLSLGNVAVGTWPYWVTAVAVWGTVLATTHIIWKAQERYIELRWAWCRRMAHIRANTVLVEGIPEEFQSDEQMAKFFDVLFPGKVKRTYCVRDTSELVGLLHLYHDAEYSLRTAKYVADNTPEAPPMVRPVFCGAKIDAVEHFQEAVNDLEQRIAVSRSAINEASKPGGSGQFYCSAGFVTFTERSDAEVAVRLTNISSDTLEWRIDHPPEPGDVLWADLMQDPTAEITRHVLGYGLVAGLYFAYMPLVVGITNIAKIIDMGPLQPFWAGIAPTFGLTLMVSFLPTFFIAIFRLFFTLKAEAWAQQRLQQWYFWFQVWFVVMATAIGQNTRDFTRTVATQPFALFAELANSMPYATHFYINFIVLQWVTHIVNLLRYVNLSKYLAFRAVYEDEEAAARSEPEDQDYYGIGSRSARWTTVLVIGIVFGTLCPPMYVFVFLNFAICRLVYGYLIPYAETKKADLGGVFWTTQLKHTFHGLLVYCVLMTGVLYARGPGIWPTVVVAPSLGYVLLAARRFDTHFAWYNVPFHELMSKEGRAADENTVKRTLNEEYEQIELNAPLPSAK